MDTVFIPMSKPSFGKEEAEAVVQVLESGWITTGPKCAEFEEQFARLTGARFGQALSSGTAGMHLIFKTMGLAQGDEVITPSMTFASTVNQIVLAGARPVFADIDPDTLLVRPDEIERLITSRTRAIIPVHFAGAPADMDAIEEVAGPIPVIEDAAHAVGTLYKGRHIGRKNTAVFSFHPIKNITTGEGGMVTGNDEDLMKRLRLQRFHGIVLGEPAGPDVVGDHPEHHHRVFRGPERRCVAEVEVDQVVHRQPAPGSRRDDVDALVDARASGSLGAEDAAVGVEVQQQVHRFGAGVVARVMPGMDTGRVEFAVAESATGRPGHRDGQLEDAHDRGAEGSR